MDRPAEIHRTTLDALDDVPHAGVYVIAYLGRVLYVGKAEDSVAGRLASHMYNSDAIGEWMRSVDDWPNVRLDVLTPPYDGWIAPVEEALIRKFTPLFNTAFV